MNIMAAIAYINAKTPPGAVRIFLNDTALEGVPYESYIMRPVPGSKPWNKFLLIFVQIPQSSLQSHHPANDLPARFGHTFE